MWKSPVVALLFLLVSGCQQSDTKVLIGATAVTGPGGPVIAGSVVVIAGKTIRAVGQQKDVPVPQDSERTNLAGKWLVSKGDGRIAPGEPANLVVLNRAPSAMEPPRAGDVSRELVEGQWRPGH
jgi:imidazolonepropionase-like amidohydrolase